MYTTTDLNIIIQIIRRIITNNIVEIILFGSYAKGTPDNESDIDIAVITDKKLQRNEKLSLLNTLLWETAQHGYNMDFIFKLSNDYEKDKKFSSTLSKKIFETGKSLWKKR